ncbi:MAG: WD-repeat protein [Chthonomonadales bacterium]|nr:WD-repeat protein [Chthonomonadales bacterium]
MADDFKYDVFLSHNSKDKPVARALAERLRDDGVRVWLDEWIIKPGDSIPTKIEEGLEGSRILILCMSAYAFGSDWATLESQTFRFRDPLNRERRFIPLRLDTTPIKSSLALFLYIDWRPRVRKQAYRKLLEACLPLTSEKSLTLIPPSQTNPHLISILKGHTDYVRSVALTLDGRKAVSASNDNTLRVWNMETGHCLATLSGHTGLVLSVALTSDGRKAISASSDYTLRVWNLETGQCLAILTGHTRSVYSVALSSDDRKAISASSDCTLRVWDLETRRCLATLQGHSNYVMCVALSSDDQRAISASADNTLRVWDLETGKCLTTLEGHVKAVASVALSFDARMAVSGSYDNTLRVWDLKTGQCLATLKGHKDSVRSVALSSNDRKVISASADKTLLVWDLSKFINELNTPDVDAFASPSVSEQVQYTNAKVLLVGDTSAGKTGLAHRLATQEWKPSDGSTIGAWSTQWKLPNLAQSHDLEKEIWLWDFGGQADQRLIHQLYMDRTALILLLFDADKENVLPGLRDWQTALRRSIPSNTPQLLVAGRIDAGFKASRAKLQGFADENGFRYFETSAKEGQGCEELRQAIMETIAWGNLERRTSPRIFKRIKDEVLKLRDEGQVLLTFKDLREMLRQRLRAEPEFGDAVLETVIGLLDGPGAVKELDYGTYILLQPEWINAYAQAVIRTLRQDPSELGCLPLRSIEEGKLLFHTVGRDGGIEEMRRLPEAGERVVLREMERQLEERGLCLRQGDKLVFPSHCGRDRPAIVKHPSVFISYAVEGYIDDIYATLVVKLIDSEAFKLKELWRDAADFETLADDHYMGIKLAREAADSGEISVYFAPGVTTQEQVIFANYIHAHLEGHSEKTQRLRHYVCPHCHTPKGNSEVLMQKLLTKRKAATVECDNCEKRFDLWDNLEQLFASAEVRAQVEGMQAEDVIRLDSRRKGKLLALEVAARISSADQKCFEIPGTEDDGIDMELEFTDDGGHGTGRRLYLQLKSGNSHLRTRKTDGAEIFDIKEPRWVSYWLQQDAPVMLVIGTLAAEGERFEGKDKLEFTNVRWMEISSYLKRESEDGKKPVKSIVFKGERLDLTSVRKWRKTVLDGEAF